jgi:hypothetical protein
VAEQVRLWRIRGGEVEEVPRGRLDREQGLEEWLARDIGMLHDGLLLNLPRAKARGF